MNHGSGNEDRNYVLYIMRTQHNALHLSRKKKLGVTEWLTLSSGTEAHQISVPEDKLELKSRKQKHYLAENFPCLHGTSFLTASSKKG